MRKMNLQPIGHVNPDVWNCLSREANEVLSSHLQQDDVPKNLCFVLFCFFQLCQLDRGGWWEVVTFQKTLTGWEPVAATATDSITSACCLQGSSAKSRPSRQQSLISSSACRRRESVWSSIFPISLCLQESFTNLTAAVSETGRASYEWFIVIIIVIRNLLLKIPCFELASCTKRKGCFFFTIGYSPYPPQKYTLELKIYIYIKKYLRNLRCRCLKQNSRDLYAGSVV